MEVREKLWKEGNARLAEVRKEKPLYEEKYKMYKESEEKQFEEMMAPTKIKKERILPD